MKFNFKFQLTVLGSCNICSSIHAICSALGSVSLSQLETIEPPHDKTNKMICTPSEDSDQPGQPLSLIRVFAVRSGIAKDMGS